jgi:integrase
MWVKHALADGYAPATVGAWLNLLSMILTDAVDQRLIPSNPIHKHRRRGRRARRIRPEKIWATPQQALQIADQAGLLGGPTARLLIIVAAWTGCRWGELAGLHRRNIDLVHRVITIDRNDGALHESRGNKRWIGPPKTAASARRIHLPAFLVELLRAHLAKHPYEYVFIHRQRDLAVAVHLRPADLPTRGGRQPRPSRSGGTDLPGVPGVDLPRATALTQYVDDR